MNRNNYIGLFLLLIGPLCFGQRLNFLFGNDFDPGNIRDAVVDDVNGWIYITGEYDFTGNSALNFETNSANLPQSLPDYQPANFDTDVFVAKYNIDGSFIWVRGVGGDGDDVVERIKLDKFGEVYIVGSFNGSVIDLDPGVVELSVFNSGVTDGFALHLNANGGFESGYAVHDTGFAYYSGVAFDDSNNIYLAGSSGGQVFFLRTPDFFSVADYSIELTAVTTGFGHFGEDIFIKSNGNVLVNGIFDGEIDFDPATPGTKKSTSGGNYDIFFAEYTSTGAYVNHKTVAGLGNEFILKSLLDPSDNLVVAGVFDDQTNFNTSGGTTNLSPNSFSDDVFVAKFNNSGALSWVRSWGNLNDDAVYGLALNNSSEVFVTGRFDGTVDFDPSVGTFDLTSNGEDAFLLKLDATGNFVDALGVGGEFYDEGQVVAASGSDVVLFAGFESDAVDVDRNCNVALITTGYGFIKYEDIPLAAVPIVPSPGPITYSNVSSTTLDGSFPHADPQPDGYLVVFSANEAPDFVPVDGLEYCYNQEVGAVNGNIMYVVQNSSVPGFSLVNLTEGEVLYFKVYSFNGFGASINYLQSDPLSGSRVVGAIPAQCEGDATPPIISNITAPTSVALGGSVNISASVVDDQGCPISEVKVVYAALDELEPDNPIYVEKIMTPQSVGSSVYTATISDKTEGIGLIFNIEATDAAGNPQYSNEFSVPVTISNNGYTIPYNSFGSLQSNYRIVSVPLTGFNSSINNVFDELGTYDKTKWRMYQYENGNTTELSGSSSMALGRGYWLIAKDNPGAITVGGGTTTGAKLYEPYTINLSPGWNLIGNPYNFDIDWLDILGWNGDPSEITLYRLWKGGPNYVDGAELEKFSGGFVFVTGTNSFALEIPAYRDESIQNNGRKRSMPGRLTNSLDQADWEVILKVKNGEMINTFGGVGMNTTASEELDRFDDLTIPRFLDYVEIVHDNPVKFNSYYSKDVVPTHSNYVWDFTIESSTTDPLIQLSWDNSYFGNNDRQLYLWDDALSKFVNMRVDSVYSIDKNVSKNLKVIYGSEAFVKEKIAVSSLVFHDVVPNPAKQKATISFSIPESLDAQEIELSTFDLLGRKVWTYTNQFDSGYHEVEMTIDDASANGLHIVQIKSGKRSQFKRLIIE